MNRVPFQLVDNRGPMGQLSTVSDHHQRKGKAMVYVGLNVSGKSLVAYAVNERKQRVFLGEQPATRAGLWEPVRQVGRNNRDGRGEVRRVLLQCAHTVVRMKSAGAKPLQQFYARIAKRRVKKIAIVALARKLVTMAYGVLKSRQPYDPRRLQPA